MQELEPEEFTNYEAGFKWTIAPKLLLQQATVRPIARDRVDDAVCRRRFGFSLPMDEAEAQGLDVELQALGDERDGLLRFAPIEAFGLQQRPHELLQHAGVLLQVVVASDDRVRHRVRRGCGEGRRTFAESVLGFEADRVLAIPLALTGAEYDACAQVTGDCDPFFPVNPRAVEQFGGMTDRQSAWSTAENYVGNGPFRLTRWATNQVIEVEKSPTYWDAGRVRLNGIRFYPIENVATELTAFLAGRLHLTSTVPPDRIPSLRESHPDQLMIQPYLGTYFFRINVTRPPFDDPRVRRAVAHAIARCCTTSVGRLPRMSSSSKVYLPMRPRIMSPRRTPVLVIQ